MPNETTPKKATDYLDLPTLPMNVTDRKISELTEYMARTGFQGRKLGESVETWVRMLKEKEIVILMGLAGAMTPAGMRRIISFFIKNRMIDCLVSTGANIFHDCHEALGGKHYLGTHMADDSKLFSEGIDRVYDVFASEKDFMNTDNFISDFSKTLEKERPYSSREFLYLLGKYISEKGGASDSIIVSAYKSKIPVFVPALNDCAIGIGLLVMRRSNCNINIDQMKDVDEITQIIEQARKTGVIYVGGGVPKNFIQQTKVIASFLGISVEGHNYAIQYTVDMPQFGGLSGCTFEEAVSWGKISRFAKKVQVFVDATIALPIVSHALLEKTRDFISNRAFPIYDWTSGKLKLSFK